MHLFVKSVALLGCVSSAFAAFAITTSDASYTIDAGSAESFIVTVSRANCDITSIKYRGVEYQYQSTFSHIASGLGSGTTVSATTINSQYAKITCVAKSDSFDLTHYYVVKSGDSIVYMATNTNSQPAIGELRYIARLDSAKLPLEYPFGTPSTTVGGTAIEGSDVYLVNGETRSKFYSSERFIDDKVHCVTASDATIHACMVLSTPGKEASSGGPFFRDINTNNGGAYTSLYNYMNSGHVQTEAYRTGLHGPYALQFSRSGIPKSVDANFAFFSDLGISGYVADSGRGVVKGTATGVASGFQIVLHWYNSASQYWVYASSSGAFTSPAMKPGTYTMKLYQGEFALGSQSVTVTSGGTTTSNIAGASQSRNTLWKIGEWDGQPMGFRNADKQLRMHPSDSRMGSWGPLTYTVGSSAVGDFPMALFKSVNTPATIKFTLSSAPSGTTTLRIGTTLSFAGARPVAKVNSWSGATPAAPTKIDSRGVTRGAYRGFGEVYDVTIPAGTLVSGSNTITIDVASGSSGDTYLQPNVIFDAVELFN
ncbi:hypothetical protein V496_00309 [Pseudogymnoascus sp. VKM F-4515 (FW-2607)]|nr:hypothetical protein V496_00309 [Pseudogymnoascus sp. VKM F-4515 (FW-2607)]KFY90527.1 hypothetical protein V498_05893 [Pseudogymnoascus sp. VKM F-4517 (FW-2822)]